MSLKLIAARAIIYFCVVVLPTALINARNNQIDQEWEVIQSSRDALLVSYKPEIKGFEMVSAGGLTTYKPIIKSAYEDFKAPGAPMILKAAKNFYVPGPKSFYVENIEIVSWKSVQGKIAPGYIAENINGFTEKSYSYDEAAYRDYSETPWVNVEYKGIARDRHVAAIEISAAQYDKKNGRIEIPEEVRIKIRFVDSKPFSASSLPEDFTIPTALNPNAPADWKIVRENIRDESKKSNNYVQATTDNWFKITIEQEGIYRINSGKLSSAGINIPAGEINSIKIYGNGGEPLSENVSTSQFNTMNELPVIVKTKGGSIESIIFYAKPAYGFYYSKDEGTFRHYLHPYAQIHPDRRKEQSHYFLTWGGAPGKRAAEAAQVQGQAVRQPVNYTEMYFYEEELKNAFVDGSGRVWFGGSYFPRVFSNAILHDLDRGGDIFYRFAAAQRGSGRADMKVYENGNYLDYIYLDSGGEAYWGEETATLSASKIQSDNRSVLKYEYEPKTSSPGTPFFDWHEIHFPRRFIPIDGEIGFFTEPDKSGIAEYNINGFNAEIYGFDVTAPDAPQLIKNTSTTGGMFVFKSEWEENNPKRYFISSNLREPPSIEKAPFGNLRGNHANTDMIVIAHPELEKSANEFKKYRESKGEISVTVVNTSHIYNEFGYGIASPTAIRDFIAYAFYNWDTAPKYALLWGDGHYDYKQLSTNQPNYVPTYQTENIYGSFSNTSSYTTDDFFVRVAGDDVFWDLAIGRITIDKPEAGFWVVDKIRHYEENSSVGPWRTTFTFVADDSWTSKRMDGSQHTSQTEDVANNILPPDFQMNKIYLVEYPRENVPGGVRKPEVMEDMVETVNTSGNVLLSWIGHGNPRVWAHEEIFERSITVPMMTNLDKLFFLTAATCDFGRFDMADIQSGSEELFLSESGGAIGVFAASRLVYSGSNFRILSAFVNRLFERQPETMKYPTLGEVMYSVKQQTFDETNDAKYFLLGDPSMRLLLPELEASIDSINGVYVQNDIDTADINALEEITIKGRILGPGGGAIREDFNGTAVITMLDSDEQVVVTDIDDSRHNIKKMGGTLNRSSYKVENGRFTANFIIPKDISFSGSTGRLYVYAYNDKNEYAQGGSRAFRVTGINIQGITDMDGPDISIYLDSREFKEGATVSAEPLLIVDLADQSGINTTGKGIGHKIEAWINDNPESINLTQKFRTSLENSNSGAAEDVLYGLEPGLHKIKVRAWDVFNNYSIEETHFRILPSGEVVISELASYPNPVENTRSATFRFVHNLNPPYRARLDIYTADGKEIKTIEESLSSIYYGQLFWDGFDKWGRYVPSGAYYYQLTLISGDGAVARESAGLNIIK